MQGGALEPLRGQRFRDGPRAKHAEGTVEGEVRRGREALVDEAGAGGVEVSGSGGGRRLHLCAGLD